MILDVGQGHKVNYEVFGNPEGAKILFLHGGPGLGYSDSDKAIFNPSRLSVIFVDQRGCGKSIPRGGLAHNTTSALISDLEKVLNELNVKSVTLFGGSWGATLAVLFAARYPERVDRLILRGFFSASRSTTDIYLRGKIQKTHPQEWNRLLSHVEKGYTDQVPEYFFKGILQKKDNYERLLNEWSRYGFSLSRKHFLEGEIDKILSDTNSDRDRVLIELNYALNDFFIPEGFVYNQAATITGIPTHIIHGTYDWICPPEDAKKLASAIRNSEITWVDAGHSMAEEGIQKAVTQVLQKIN